MNVLFLSLLDFDDINQSGIYTDVLREFIKNGHYVYAISPVEKRNKREIHYEKHDGYQIVKPCVGNITNTPIFEKGLSLLRFSREIIQCIKKEIGEAEINLFILATPPVTNDVIINFVKRTYKSKIYLLLKDIWPGNIFKVKLPGGIFTQTCVHLFFRKHERRLYELSDYIGCMSPANMEYVLKNNHWLDPQKVHINPNSICPEDVHIAKHEKNQIREKYNIPIDKICFVYGGTLGPGQDIQNVINCLRKCNNADYHFFIAGRGIQEKLVTDYIKDEKPENVTYSPWIPKEEYKRVLAACDVGLVFLRYNSNTPSFPSRILSYMEIGLPIISCTSAVSDMNRIIEEGGFGWGSYSNNPDSFYDAINKCLSSDIQTFGQASRKYLMDNYTSEISYSIIMDSYSKQS